MEWFELRLSECSASLHAHPLDLPSLRAESAARETRPRRNEIKRGHAHPHANRTLRWEHNHGAGILVNHGAGMVEDVDDAALYEWEYCGGE
jgi:hypothetical protein